MKSRAPIYAFYAAIIFLVIFSGIIVWRLMFLPPCTPTKDSSCLLDGASVAGLAATVMGVAAAILALLGAFALAAWWTNLDERINEQVNKETNKQVVDIFDKQLTPKINQKVSTLIQDQSAKFNEQMKELQRTLTEADNNLNNNLQNFSQVQDATIKNINDVGKALLYLSVGTRLWEQKKIKSAIAEFRKAKQLQPGDAQVNYILGEIYRKIGSYDEAIDCLKIAIATEKEFALAHFELGMAYRSQADKLYGDPSSKQHHDEEYDKAIEYLKEAKRLLPDDEEIIATLGGTYRRYGKYQDALNYYHQALDLNPDSSYALGNVASLSWHEGKLDDSRKAYRRTEELATRRIHSNISYEPFWDYYDRAMAKLVLGPKDEALDDYRFAAKLTFNPENFKSVLDGLIFLKEVENQYPIGGLNEALAIVEAGKAEAENRIAKQTTP